MDLIKHLRGSSTSTIRAEFDAVMAKLPGHETPARSVLLATIAQTHGTLAGLYGAASPTERQSIMRFAKKVAADMWQQGAWPSSLGWEIAALNVASWSMPGGDAAFVAAETDRVIEEAVLTQKPAGHLARPSRAVRVHGAPSALADRVPRRERTGRHRLRELALEARQAKQAAFAEIADQAMSLARRMGR